MNSRSTDLVDFLAYEGARDGTTSVTLLDDDMVYLPCWTPRFCRLLIDAAEATGAFGANAFDPVPAHEVSLNN